MPEDRQGGKDSAKDAPSAPASSELAVRGPAPGRPRERVPIPAWYPKVLALTGIAVLVWLALYAFLGQARQLIVWLVIALFLSFALEPGVNWLARHGWRR